MSVKFIKKAAKRSKPLTMFLWLFPKEILSQSLDQVEAEKVLCFLCLEDAFPFPRQILIDDESLYDLSPNERAHLRQKKMGFVFQTFNLIPYLSAMQNVQVPLFLSGMNEKDAKRTSQSSY